MNTNIFGLTKKSDYQYKYEKSNWYSTKKKKTNWNNSQALLGMLF